MFLDHFDMLISKIIFKKLKKYILFWCICKQKIFWKATATLLSNTSKVVVQLPSKDYSGQNVKAKTIILSMSFYVSYSREVTFC